jgi:hypothetical protein
MPWAIQYVIPGKKHTDAVSNRLFRLEPYQMPWAICHSRRETFFFFFKYFFGGFFLFCSYNIQHCFICRPSDSTVPTDAGIEPRTVATCSRRETFFLNFFLFFSYFIQHCFICRPSDSTVPTDAGIEPRTVATGALAVRRSNH